MPATRTSSPRALLKDERRSYWFAESRVGCLFGLSLFVCLLVIFRVHTQIMLVIGTSAPSELSAVPTTASLDCQIPSRIASTPKLPSLSMWQESTVVVTLAMGNVTQTRLVERWLWSLKTRGDWESGRIAIITDDPEALRPLISQQLPFQQSLITILPAHHEDLYPTNAKGRPLHFKKEKLRYKRLKTMLLDYLDEMTLAPNTNKTIEERKNPKSYRFAVYIDVDIVLARPLSSLLQDFQDQMIKKGVFTSPFDDNPRPLEISKEDEGIIEKQSANSTTENRREDEGEETTITGNTKKARKDAQKNLEDEKAAALPFMNMFTDCPTCARQNTNSGFIILHRMRSRRCLKEWKTLMTEGSHWGVYDQRFLRDVRADGHCKIHVLPDHHRLYPTWKDMRLLQSATVVHNTNSYNAKKIPAHVQARYFEYLLNTTKFSELEFF